MNKANIIFILLFGVITCHVFSQEDARVLASADTSNFSVNVNEEWLLYNSYVDHYKTDSAQLEIIIQHDNNIDWQVEQFVGTIKSSSLVPRTIQNLLFILITDTYSVRIDQEGKCYLKFLTGILPSTEKVIIPVRVYYKI